MANNDSKQDTPPPAIPAADQFYVTYRRWARKMEKLAQKRADEAEQQNRISAAIKTAD